jgi:cell division protein FtsW
VGSIAPASARRPVPGDGAVEAPPRGLLRPALVTLSRLLRRPLASYYLVLGSAGLLLLLGLVMVFSASTLYSLREHGSVYTVFLRQLMWVAVAVPVAWLISRTPPARLRLVGYPLLLASIALLVLTYVPGVGYAVNGNTNWIDFGGPFRVQPSEIAKLALVVWGADIYARKRRLLDQWRHIIVPFFPGAAIVVALVVGQRDLGTALVVMAVVLTLLWVVGVPLRLFSLALLVVLAVGTRFVVMSPERLQRVTRFHDPFGDLQDSGYQAGHGIYALGTGGWWGVGPGASRQKWGTLPEAHTDFIFAVIGEEFGLLGSLSVVALLLVLGYAGVRIAMRASDLFVRLAAAAVTGWLLAQAMVNIGGVLGLLPVTGIPLPLVSYGGSALVPTVVAVGMLVAFARAEPGAAQALAARRRRGWLFRGRRRAARASGAAQGRTAG